MDSSSGSSGPTHAPGTEGDVTVHVHVPVQVHEVPTLSALCLQSIMNSIITSGYNAKHINDLCKRIPDHFLEPILLFLVRQRVITDVTFMFFLLPTRRTVTLTNALHIKNATFKQIGYNCPNLSCLDLSGCAQVSNPVIRLILQRCPLLTELRLDGCHKVTDAAFDVAESPFCTLYGCLSLEVISLQGCPQITGDIVATLNKLSRNLKYLNLSQCKQVSSAAAQRLFEHHRLKYLNLAFIDQLTDEVFACMPHLCHSSNSNADSCSPLLKLNIGKSAITDASMFRLSYLAALVEIRLQWCHGVTDAGIEALVYHCPRLRVIDLMSCIISDRTLAVIAHGAKELQELDLSWCSQITDAGLSSLSETIRYDSDNEGDCDKSGHCDTFRHKIKPKLERLSVVWCTLLTDAAFHSLHAIPSLKAVNAAGCSLVSKECVERLRGRHIAVEI